MFATILQAAKVFLELCIINHFDLFLKILILVSEIGPELEGWSFQQDNNLIR